MNTSRLIRLLLLLVLMVSIALAIVYRDRFDAAALQAWINDAGVLAPPTSVLQKDAVLLTQAGFQDVHVVRGGMTK